MNQNPVIYRPSAKAQRIKFFIPYSAIEIREAVKKMNTSFYHPGQKFWSIENTRQNLDKLKGILGSGVSIESPKTNNIPIPARKLGTESEKALEKFEQCIILKGYSRNTMKNYRNELVQFFSYFDGRDFKTIRKEEVESFVAMLISKHKISSTKQNQLINAIKFYYEKVLGKPREFYDIQRPKRA